jgi:general secretion pathway protein H
MGAAPMYPASPKDNSNRKRAQRGVVLLDVVAALAIVALAAFVLMPGPRSSIGTAELSAEAVRISAEFRKGRAKALTTGSVADVTVDPGNKRIQVDGANPISIRDGVVMNWVTSNQCPIRGGSRALRYLADGRSCGGVMTLSASGREIELRVDWLTGRVEMSAK